MDNQYGTLRVYLIVSTPSGKDKLITLHRRCYIHADDVKEEARSAIQANHFLPQDRIGVSFTRVEHLNPKKL